MRTSGSSADDALAALSGARTRVVAQPTAARVADALREQISDGLFPPGSRLPEEAIGEALAVSRNTVREAFIELAAERLLVRAPNRGVFVAVLDEPAIRDIYRARRILEVGAIRNAVEGFSAASARAAVDEGQRARDAGDSSGVGNANQHFHREVVALAGSTRLDRLMAHMLAEMRLVFHAARANPHFYELFVDDNDSLCTLLERGRFAEAADAMDDYLTRSQVEVLRDAGS
ncbi:MAG TPA: GntR family transcriptional regulator [Nakamurella sp.]